MRQVLAQIRRIPVDAKCPQHRGIDPEAVPGIVEQKNELRAGNPVQVALVRPVRQVSGHIPRPLHDHELGRVLVHVPPQPGQRRLLRPGRHSVGLDWLFVPAGARLQHRQVAREGDQAGVSVRVDDARHHEASLQVHDPGVPVGVA